MSFKAEPKSYSITSKRIVPYELKHGGQKAVCIKLPSGFTAWGFADSYEDAEQVAAANATRIATSELAIGQLVTVDSRMGGSFPIKITMLPDNQGHMEGTIQLQGNPDWHNHAWKFYRTEIKEVS